MLDLKWIRNNLDDFRHAMSIRGIDQAIVNEVISLDNEHRRVLQEVETDRTERNSLSKEIGALTQQTNKQKTGSAQKQHATPQREDLIARASFLGNKLKGSETTLADLDKQLQRLLAGLPNTTDPKVPIGQTGDDDIVVREEGERPSFDFDPRTHWDLGETLDIIDFARGAKISGSRFYVLKGLGARLERALISFMLDLHSRDHGYQELYLPAMVKEQSMWSGGWLPKFSDNMYHDAEEDYWFVPTAEVALTNFHRDEIIEPNALPFHYVAYSPCFRREKMSAGRDVRGLKRGHQFDKVELYKYTDPEHSDEELESMLQDAEVVLQRLQIPYRVKLLCSGELGFSSRISFDLDAWAPGTQEWLEVSSVSNCGDFQARRANIRFRREKGKRPEFANTLNGSGLALPRTLIALLENHQRKDGTVIIPKALWPYMGGVKTIASA